MAFDVKKWLVEEMKFSAAEADEMAPKFSGERVSVLERSQLSVSEIAAAKAELTKTQNEYTAANTRLNAEMAEWATLTAAEKAQATELQASLEAAKTRTVQLEHRLTTLATEHGVDPTALLEGTVKIPEKVAPAAAAVDMSRFVGVDQFGPLMDFQLQLPANLQYIEREHFALTGEHLDTREIITEIRTRAQQKNANIDPVAIWEGKYDIPAKRVAQAKAKYDDEMKQAEARGEERGRTNAALPGPSSPGRHAPIFGVKTNDGSIAGRTSVLKRPQPETGVRSAAAAFASHKYREKTA